MSALCGFRAVSRCRAGVLIELVMLTVLSLGSTGARAGPIYQISFAGMFTDGLLLDGLPGPSLPAGANGAPVVELSGLAVSGRLNFDLGVAPANVFSPGLSDFNSIVSNSTPIFAGGWIDLTSVVAGLPSGALPVPSIYHFSLPVGDTVNTIHQQLSFRSSTSGLGPSGLTAAFSLRGDSPPGGLFQSFVFGLITEGPSSLIPRGDFTGQTYPSFSFNPSDPAGFNNATFGATDTAVDSNIPAFTTSFVFANSPGTNHLPQIALTSVSGQELLAVPEPGSFGNVLLGVLALAASVRRSRRSRHSQLARQSTGGTDRLGAYP